MGTHELWYCKENNGRAPEYAFLDVDYTYAGELDLGHLRELARRLCDPDAAELALTGQRTLWVGDVVKDPAGDHWVYTPLGFWSRVTAFDGPLESAPLDASSEGGQVGY